MPVRAVCAGQRACRVSDGAAFCGSMSGSPAPSRSHEESCRCCRECGRELCRWFESPSSGVLSPAMSPGAGSLEAPAGQVTAGPAGRPLGAHRSMRARRPKVGRQLDHGQRRGGQPYRPVREQGGQVLQVGVVPDQDHGVDVVGQFVQDREQVGRARVVEPGFDPRGWWVFEGRRDQLPRGSGALGVRYDGEVDARCVGGEPLARFGCLPRLASGRARSGGSRTSRTWRAAAGSACAQPVAEVLSRPMRRVSRPRSRRPARRRAHVPDPVRHARSLSPRRARPPGPA
jgi:hypothetical protein